MEPLCAMALFDDATVRAFLNIRQALCALGLPCEPIPPHITLGVYERLPEQELVAWVAAFAAAHAPMRVRFTHVGVFRGKACFVAPLVTPELLRLHADFHARYDDAAGDIGLRYTLAAESFVPHVTLLTGDEPALEYALPAAVRAFSPFEGTLCSVMVGHYNPCAGQGAPLREIAEYPLLGCSAATREPAARHPEMPLVKNLCQRPLQASVEMV